MKPNYLRYLLVILFLVPLSLLLIFPPNFATGIILLMTVVIPLLGLWSKKKWFFYYVYAITFLAIIATSTISGRFVYIDTGIALTFVDIIITVILTAVLQVYMSSKNSQEPNSQQTKLLPKSLTIILGLVVIIFLGFLFTNYISVQTEWNKMVAGSNQSDLYGKQTNGTSNDQTISAARAYLNSNAAATDNITLKQLQIDPNWFATHAPASITYKDSNFQITWGYYPGCEKRQDNKTSQPNWFTKFGSQCDIQWGHTIIVTIDAKTLKPIEWVHVEYL
ncbi:MAG: hypothetical protein P4L74_05345 [Candidatus Doudnabacteria bacterium]|nr:hypothetical protein [Candidatus Doudnabacteria bacterium]